MKNLLLICGISYFALNFVYGSAEGVDLGLYVAEPKSFMTVISALVGGIYSLFAYGVPQKVVARFAKSTELDPFDVIETRHDLLIYKAEFTEMGDEVGLDLVNQMLEELE